MSGAHHCRKTLASGRVVGGRCRERPDPATTRKRFCGGKRRFVVMNELHRQFARNAGPGKRLPDPARSIAAPRQRSASRLGKTGVIDIARFGTARNNTVDVGSGFP